MQSHIILTNGRSGSNFIVNAINKHPHILNYGEVLGEWTELRKLQGLGVYRSLGDREYLDTILSSSFIFYAGQLYAALGRLKRNTPLNFKRKKNIHNIGIKDFQTCFTRFAIEDYIENRPNIKVIYLYRKSCFRRFISNKVLSHTSIAVVREDEKKQRNKILLKLEDLLEEIKIIDSENQLLQGMVDRLDKSRVFAVQYEEFFSDPIKQTEICNAMFEFLGVEPVEVQSKHSKILSNDYRDIIENYEQVKEHLVGTPYELS
jgi:hypothetical protein